jgi:hypothetical protein
MEIKLFGLTIGKKKKEHPEIVTDFNNDGATEFNLTGGPEAGGLVSSGYDEILSSIKNESELIGLYRELVLIPEVDQAIEEIVNDAVVYPKSEMFPVSLNLDNIDFPDNIKEKIIEEFENVLGLMKFSYNADDYFRDWYIDGRISFFLKVNEGSAKKGIQKITQLDSRCVKKVREYIKKKDTDGVEKVFDINEYYVYIPKEFIPGEFKNMAMSSFSIDGDYVKGIKFTKDSIVYCPSGLLDKDKRFVISRLHKAIKPANHLSQVEEAMVIYRIARAPSRRAFYVDTGNLPKNKAEAYITGLMGKFKNKLSYDSVTGKIKSSSHQKSILEDFWLPRRGDGKTTQIETLESGNSFANVTEELRYFKEKLYKALNVPIGRLDSDSSFMFGREGEITREEVKFSKYINKLRNHFANNIFSQLIKTQLVLKRIIEESEWETIVDNIFYVWEDDSHFNEMKQLEILEKRMETLERVSEFVNVYFSKNYVRKHILFQTEEEIEELAKEREEESKEEPQEEEEE